MKDEETDDHSVSEAFEISARRFYDTLLYLQPGAGDPLPCGK